MNKCSACGQKKAKRACPALHQAICPPCCGQKRHLTIPCPDDCSYLDAGRERQFRRHINKSTRAIDPGLTRKVYQDLSTVLNLFYDSIVRVRRTFDTMNDAHLLDAVQKFTRTCETESNGLIYEQTSHDPLVQSLLNAFSSGAKEIRRQIKNEVRHEYFNLTDILECLHYIAADIQATSGESGDRSGYLDFLTQFHSAPMAPEASASRIIMP